MNESNPDKLIALIEDDEQVRGILEEYLSLQAGMHFLFSAGSFEAFLGKVAVYQAPDIVLMDIGLPGINGIEGLKLIKENYPETEVIMLTVYHEPDKIFESLCAGASGYLLKNVPLEEIRAGILSLGSGGAPMSPQIARRVIERFQPVKKENSQHILSGREQQVVNGIVEGLSYKMLADRLDLSIDTIRFHIKNIYRKLHINCKAELISKTIRRIY